MNKDFISNTQLTNNQVALFYLGQEGFLFKYKNIHILINPYLSDYVDKNCCSETVKWIRNYPAPTHAEELDSIDYVLCTHTHYDHTAPYTLGKLAKANPNATFIVPAFATNLITGYGISPNKIIGAVTNTIIDCGDCEIHPIASVHKELHQDKNSNYMKLGYKMIFDDISIYYGGDCCLYDVLSDSLMYVDIMMVPINRRSYYKPRDDISENMTIQKAFILAKECNADMLIPIHYNLYNANCVNPANFVDFLYSYNPSQKFHMFVPGERFIYTK